MSYDSFVRSLRDDVMAGARKRRRFERRRRAVLTATPVLVVLAIVGSLVVRTGSDAEDASEVHTEVPTTTPLNFAFADRICDAVDDLGVDPADGDIDELARRDSLLGQILELSTLVGDPALAEASRAIASAELGSDEFLRAQVALTARCEQLDLPPSSVPPTSAAPGVLSGETIAACDAAIDLRNMMGTQDDDEPAVYRTMVESAMASGDTALEETGRAQIPVGEDDWRPGDPLVQRSSATADVWNRCRALGAPGYVPEFVPAPLGPEPRVALEDYGTVVPLQPFDGQLGPVASARIYGRDLAPVEVLGTSESGLVMRWTYRLRTGEAMECRTLSIDLMGGRATCGPEGTTQGPYPEVNPVVSDGVVALELTDVPIELDPTTAEAAFVVIETSGRRFVQRPSMRMNVIPMPGVTMDASIAVRSYDVDGNEIGCVTTPLQGVILTPC